MSIRNRGTSTVRRSSVLVPLLLAVALFTAGLIVGFILGLSAFGILISAVSLSLFAFWRTLAPWIGWSARRVQSEAGKFSADDQPTSRRIVGAASLGAGALASLCVLIFRTDALGWSMVAAAVTIAAFIAYLSRQWTREGSYARVVGVGVAAWMIGICGDCFVNAADRTLIEDGLAHSLEPIRQALDRNYAEIVAFRSEVGEEFDRLTERSNAGDSFAGTLPEVLASLVRAAENGELAAIAPLSSFGPEDSAEFFAIKRRELDLNMSALHNEYETTAISLARQHAFNVFILGRLEEAESALGDILALDPDNVDALNNLGNIQLIHGQIDRAEESFVRVRELTESDSDRYAAATNNLGTIAVSRGETGAAEALYREALTIYEELDHRGGQGAAHTNLGRLALRRGDFTLAEQFGREALEHSEAADRKRGVIAAYGLLGDSLKERKEYEAAERMYFEVVERSEAIGYLAGVARGHSDISRTRRWLNDLEGAEEMAQRALDTHREMKNTPAIGSTYSSLGNIRLAREDLDGAEEMFLQSLEIDEQLGRLSGVASNCANLGEVAIRRERTDEARAYWRRAHDLYEQIDSPHMAAQMHSWLEQLESPQPEPSSTDG
ncbi:MAG: tetratricopeptide repeat protein [Phycisphaerales bacterium]